MKRKPEFFDRMGEYEFTKTELAEMNSAIVRNNLQVERIYQEIELYKQRAKEAKASIVSLNADSMHKSHLVKNGKENRLIQCQLVRDFEAKRRKYFSVDGGDLIAEENFTPEDFQLEIPFEAPEGSAEVLADDPEAKALAEEMKNPHFAAGFSAFTVAKESGLDTINTPDLEEAEMALWKKGFQTARGDFKGVMSGPIDRQIDPNQMENPDFAAGWAKFQEVGTLELFADIWQYCPAETKANGAAAASWHDGWAAAREAKAAAQLTDLIDFSDPASPKIKSNGLAVSEVIEILKEDEGAQVLTDIHKMSGEEIKAAEAAFAAIVKPIEKATKKRPSRSKAAQADKAAAQPNTEAPAADKKKKGGKDNGKSK
jgi:hypothetical protein